MKKREIALLCCLIVVSFVFQGCGGDGGGIGQKDFVLGTARTSDALGTQKEMILDVGAFNIGSTFNTKKLVYRKSESEYETDYYNQFMVRPDDMITERTREWFMRSGLFKVVKESGGYIEATHLLTGNVSELYGDFREGGNPVARMSIRFVIVKLADESVVFSKSYEADYQVEEKAPEAMIAGFDNCLTYILSELEKDVAGEL